MSSFLDTSFNRATVLFLITACLFCAQQLNANAQVTGGGSTDFKRPANPPVHHQPRVEPAGGRLPEDAGTKSQGHSSQANSPSGSQKGAKAAANDAKTPSRPSLLPKWGDLKSGGGAKPVPQPASSDPSSTNVASASTGSNEDVEDAIEAGNNARDRKPPDYVDAERAYKLASKLAPNDERPFEGLGNIYLDQGRNEEAVLAYRKAIELKPKNPSAFENLGDAYYRLGRYQESIDASTQSVRLDPKPPGPYWTLTWANITIGEGETAGRMAQAFIYRWRPLFEGEAPYYITFAGYLGYREARRTEEARQVLAMPGKSSDCRDQNWVCRLLKYMRHEISAEQLLAEARDKGKMTEARTYIGIDLALSERRLEALPHLRWVEASGERTFTEYPLAKAWLKKLESK
jgi:tetratricopeptide (TPR) repeat protein